MRQATPSALGRGIKPVESGSGQVMLEAKPLCCPANSRLVLIGCLDATMLTLVGTLWFGVPLCGNVTVLAAGVMLFLLAALGLGLLLSTMAITQQQAMITAFFFTMPMTSLSGFGTPISSMPPFFQELSYFNPLRHVVLILRSIFLKGVGFEVLWPNLLMMGAFAIVTLSVSVLRFRKSLE
jgi:ABC-2 type transport system permease protein